MKFKLKRIKKGINNVSIDAPDYEGFFESNRNYFSVVGFQSGLSNDISIYINKIDEKWLENKFNSKRFSEWNKQQF
jgi:hypothetical protein